MWYCCQETGHVPENHDEPYVAPKPVLEASEHKWIDCESAACCCHIKDLPLKLERKESQILRSLFTSFVSLMKWWGLEACIVRSYSLLMKGRPPLTTDVENWSIPITDFRSLNVIFSFWSTSLTCCVYLLSFSMGSLASILTVSSSIPKKVNDVTGPTVLWGAKGTPIYWQTWSNVSRAFLQLAWESEMNRKSSKTLTVYLMLNLLSRTHWMADENLSNIWQLWLHPIGRQRSYQ